MHVVATCLAEPRPMPGSPGKLTGLFKLPWESIEVGPLRVVGDHVIDTRYHGDPSKALCVYPSEHLDHWREVYPEADWSAGAFGENLSTAGWTESNCCLGDILRVGGTLVQVSQPRQPCGKLARRHGVPELVTVSVAAGATGWYLRVLDPGRIAPGDSIELVAAHPREVSIAQANAVNYNQAASREELAAVLAVDALSEAWRKDFGERWLKV